MTQGDLALVAGYSRQQLVKIDKELPGHEKLFVKEGETYSLPTFVQRWVAYNVKRAQANGKGSLSKDARMMTKRAIANITGYTYQRLADINKDMTDQEKLFVEDESGKCDFAIFIRRWIDYNISRALDTESWSLEEAKTQHEIVKKRKTELEVKKMEGELVDVNEIKRLWADIANTVMQNMLRLPSKIAPQVMMLNSIEVIQNIIDTEIRDVLTDIADTPVPEYDADEAKNGEGESE